MKNISNDEEAIEKQNLFFTLIGSLSKLEELEISIDVPETSAFDNLAQKALSPLYHLK